MKSSLLLVFVSIIFGVSSIAKADNPNSQHLSPLHYISSTEFRGGWVPTIINLCFPSRIGLSEEQQKAEIIRLLEAAHYARLNNLFFQVRPECDAFYHSSIEPWSRYLTGTQGKAPAFDPLQFFITEGHRRGIAIHAWFNPYRVSINAANPNAPLHVSHRFPFFVHRIGKKLLWLDAGNPKAQDYIITVISDVMRRYDIDGVHLDDYFYPDPEFLEGKKIPDDATYRAYRYNGGKLSLGDWRRASVNVLIKRLSRIIHEQKPGILFGVSPFGIYTKGQPADIKAGLDQLNQRYADPVLWIRAGWVDYLAPQLYWKNKGPQSFHSLLRWWRSPSVNPRGVPIYPGIALERLTEKNWPVQEIALQLRVEKTTPPRKHGGFILWSMKQLEDNVKGVAPIVRAN
ncbi:MAG: family 10 glycosylhydrolase [Chthoniobacterales bacterium]|nr:family 10 glycosylhydrolase [Chthoniobacterales bacterium]